MEFRLGICLLSISTLIWICWAQPPMPHPIYGFLLSSDGEPADNISVIVTNLRTGARLIEITHEDGSFLVELANMAGSPPYMVGDPIRIDFEGMHNITLEVAQELFQDLGEIRLPYTKQQLRVLVHRKSIDQIMMIIWICALGICTLILVLLFRRFRR